MDTSAPTVTRMKKWMTAVAVMVGLAGAGLLVYWQWDPIWAFIFSPIGGFVTKILFSAKAMKVAVGAAFAVGAGWVAVRKKLRRDTPEPEQHLAPPVYGPPEEATPPTTPPTTPPHVLPTPAPPPASAEPRTYGTPQEAPTTADAGNADTGAGRPERPALTAPA